MVAGNYEEGARRDKRAEGIKMRFLHDCHFCVPLGQFLDNDIYFCGEGQKTVVARYGDSGEQYSSSPSLQTPEIEVAVAMAKAAGYIK